MKASFHSIKLKQ